MAPLAASCRANNGVTCEWAPDGRHFLTATLAPRLRVDNGFQIFRWEVMLPCFANKICSGLRCLGSAQSST